MGAGERTGVAAIVVSYEPELPAFVASVANTAAQVDRVVVVDNGSSNQAGVAAELAELAKVEVLLQEDNLGIATALNNGVRRLSENGLHAWVLTLDQDTVLREGAVATVLDAFGRLDEAVKRRCGVVALAYRPVRDGHGIRRWLGRRSATSDVGGGFRERRLLITSGNLVRREVAESVPYEGELFIDQVDSAFSLAVRARGWSLLDFPMLLMDHQVGQLFEAGGRVWRYQPGQRLYYIARNSTELVLRAHLPLGVYLMQLAVWMRAYLHVNGLRALPRLTTIVVVGLFDGATRRLGRRSYGILAEPARRRGRALSAADAPGFEQAG